MVSLRRAFLFLSALPLACAGTSSGAGSDVADGPDEDGARADGTVIDARGDAPTGRRDSTVPVDAPSDTHSELGPSDAGHDSKNDSTIGDSGVDAPSDVGARDAAKDRAEESPFASDGSCSTVVTTSVPVASLTGAAVPPCPSGSAHPTVCCTGGPAQKTECVVDDNEPFRACGASSYPFPDPEFCCPLAGGACLPSTAGTTDAGPSCASGCPPGAYPGDASSVLFCGAPTGQVCCVGNSTDELCTGYSCPGPTGTPCGACPSGWTLSDPPDLCCRSTSCGTECLSLLPAVPTFFISSGCDSDSTGCSCFAYDNTGNIYEYSCDSAQCTCTIDGRTTKTLPASSCGFVFPSACGYSFTPP
jgi:hypothetical protein